LGNREQGDVSNTWSDSTMAFAVDIQDPRLADVSRTAEPVVVVGFTRRSVLAQSSTIAAMALPLVYCALVVSLRADPTPMTDAMIKLFGVAMAIPFVVMCCWTWWQHRRTPTGLVLDRSGMTVHRRLRPKHIGWEKITYIDVAVSTRRNVDTVCIRVAPAIGVGEYSSGKGAYYARSLFPTEIFSRRHSEFIAVLKTKRKAGAPANLAPARALDMALRRFAGDRHAPASWHQSRSVIPLPESDI